MSDDFDKDDLPSWLSGDDEPDKPDQPPGDDETPEWQEGDEPGEPPKRTDKLGFTGDLPWLQEFGDKPDDPVQRAEQDLFDWQQGEGDDEAGQEPEDASALPEWVLEAAEPDETLPTNPNIPSWLMDDETVPEPPVSQSDEPQWGDTLPDDFLAKADQIAETNEADISFDEWLNQQQRAAAGPNLEEEVPDDLIGDVPTGKTGALPSGTGELPDWYLGLDELQEDDAPDWMSQPQDAGAVDTPSWLSDMGEDELPPAATQPQGEFDDDFFASIGAAQPPQDEPNEAPLDLSWLNDPQSQAASEATSEDAVDEDFFASLGVGQPSTPQSSSAPDEPEDAEFDFAWLTEQDDEELPDAEQLSATGIDDATAAILQIDAERANLADIPPQSTPAEDDIFDLAWMSDEQETEPDAELDADLLAALGVGDEDDQPYAAPDMSWLEQPAGQAETPATSDGAAWTDDDFFAEFESEQGERQPAAQQDDTFRFDFDDAVLEEDEQPDWLQAIAPQPPQQPQGPSEEDIEALFALPDEPDDDAFMPELTGDLDDFLSKLDEATSDKLPQTGDLLEQPDFDIDDLFSQAVIDEFGQTPKPSTPDAPRDIEPALPDFLRDLEANVGTVSASALVRGRKDRPVEDLPDRLQALHERGQKLPSTGQLRSAESDALANILPGIDDALAPAQITPGVPGIGGALALTTDQKDRLDILRGLAGTAEDASPVFSAVDRSFEDEELQEDDEFSFRPSTPPAPEPAPVIAVPKPQRRTRVQVDRILIALFLTVVMVLPFINDNFRIGTPPPALFAPGSSADMAFRQISSVGAGDLVLVGVEYGPTAAAELDGLLEAVLRHILREGATPVLIGGNPVGMLHAANVAERVAIDPLVVAERGDVIQANRDYYVARYLAGGAVGLRMLGESAQPLLMNDIRGQATNLFVSELDSFGLMVVVADEAEEVRNYAEQLAPLSRAPLVVATNYGSAPFAEPYVGMGGLLVGMQDAQTYLAMLGMGDGLILPPPDADVPDMLPELPLASTEEATGEAPGADETEAPLDTELPLEQQLATLNAMREGTQNAAQTQSADVLATSGVDLSDVTATLEAAQTLSAEMQETGGAAVGDLTATLEAASELSEQMQATADAAVESARATTNAALDAAQPTSTPRPSNTPAPSNTPRPTNTEGPTPTASDTPLAALTDTPDVSPTRTPTVTRTPSVTPTQTETPFEAQTGVVASNQTVNVRSGPGTTYGIIDAVPSRGTVEVIGQNSDGSWLRVIVPETGTEGWVSAALIRLVTPTPDGSSFKPDTLARQLRPQQQVPDVTATLQAAQTLQAAGQETANAALGDATGVFETAQAFATEAASTGGATFEAAQTLGAELQVTGGATFEAAQTLGAEAQATGGATLEAAQTLAAEALATGDAVQEQLLTPEPEATAAVGDSMTDGGAADQLAAIDALATTRYSDERWYSMTLGLIAVIAIIAAGAVFNILRALFTRRNR